VKIHMLFIVILCIFALTLGCKLIPQKPKIVSSFYPYTFAAKYLGRTDYDYVTIFGNIEDRNFNFDTNIKAKLLTINGNGIDEDLINKIKHENLFIASNYTKLERKNYLVYLNPNKMEDVFFGLSQIFCKFNEKKCKYFTKRCGDYVALIEEVKNALINLSKKIKEKGIKILIYKDYYRPLFDFMQIEPILFSEKKIKEISGKKIVIFPSKEILKKYSKLLEKYRAKAIIFDPNMKGDYAKTFIMFVKNFKEAMEN